MLGFNLVLSVALLSCRISRAHLFSNLWGKVTHLNTINNIRRQQKHCFGNKSLEINYFKYTYHLKMFTCMSVYPEKEKQDIIPIETGYQMHR